ncbi:MAG: phospholipase [gamma proteobacterium symbiont of Bathyaustriella thionipta]|nr:phospholipase [gamma proteobacterium symbiont of Bathyaustriella thionipta]MCU7955129.1 phospholipase [gamma proteobacterium symbiont of Bathyaustriella thionipta]MCU7966089.1 phospholipase [gamma proteobacterium symbiont of Bathyaustriella thionipta]
MLAKQLIKVCLAIAFITLINACGTSEPEITRVNARPAEPTITIKSGEHPLGLGGLRLVNRKVIWRDGTLYIPNTSVSSKPMPLLVWLHGGGGRADSFEYMFPLAEKLGVVLLMLDARHNTWDGIDSPFGPDVMFINAALRHTFERVAIDPQRVGLGGLSDGASYALALGRVNGDIFTHLIAVAPGHLAPPAPPIKQPKIFVAHGTRDNVYNVMGSRNFIVPRLKHAGYDVTYLEFDGPHWVPATIAYKLLAWLRQ